MALFRGGAFLVYLCESLRIDGGNRVPLSHLGDSPRVGVQRTSGAPRAGNLRGDSVHSELLHVRQAEA